eukprot:6192366-Pleurochrysis_carterae.AAC.1
MHVAEFVRLLWKGQYRTSCNSLGDICGYQQVGWRMFCVLASTFMCLGAFGEACNDMGRLTGKINPSLSGLVGYSSFFGFGPNSSTAFEW